MKDVEGKTSLLTKTELLFYTIKTFCLNFHSLTLLLCLTKTVKVFMGKIVNFFRFREGFPKIWLADVPLHLIEGHLTSEISF